MTGALAAHYARALADAIFRPDSGLKPEDAVVQFRNAEQLITNSKDLQIALLSPAVPKQRKLLLVSKLADELGLHRLVTNFLRVIVAHRRTHELKSIRQEFETVVDERLGWVRAEITSGRELNSAQRQEVELALGQRLGKFIRADYKVDPALIAGVRARVASKEYDATVNGKLESMRQRLLASI